VPAPQAAVQENPQPLLPSLTSPLQRLEEQRTAITRRAAQPVQSTHRLKKVRTLRGSLYIFFILASIPLFLGVVFDDKPDVYTRLELTIKELPKQDKARVMKVYNEFKRDEAELQELLQVLPDREPGCLTTPGGITTFWGWQRSSTCCCWVSCSPKALTSSTSSCSLPSSLVLRG
jgi:hypothetical protein